MMNIAASRNRAVFDFGAPFLLLFWRSKKVKSKIKRARRKKYHQNEKSQIPPIKKPLSLLKGFFKRIWQLPTLRILVKYDRPWEQLLNIER